LRKIKMQAVGVTVLTTEAAFESETTALPWENRNLHTLLVQYAYTNTRYRSIRPILPENYTVCTVLIDSFFIRCGTII